MCLHEAIFRSRVVRVIEKGKKISPKPTIFISLVHSYCRWCFYPWLMLVSPVLSINFFLLLSSFFSSFSFPIIILIIRIYFSFICLRNWEIIKRVGWLWAKSMPSGWLFRKGTFFFKIKINSSQWLLHEAVNHVIVRLFIFLYFWQLKILSACTWIKKCILEKNAQIQSSGSPLKSTREKKTNIQSKFMNSLFLFKRKNKNERIFGYYSAVKGFVIFSFA